VFDGAKPTGHSAVTDECNGLGEPFLAGEVDEVKVEDAGVLDLLCEPTCDGRSESTLSRAGDDQSEAHSTALWLFHGSRSVFPIVVRDSIAAWAAAAASRGKVWPIVGWMVP
jgi:hypothetical protein